MATINLVSAIICGAGAIFHFVNGNYWFSVISIGMLVLNVELYNRTIGDSSKEGPK